MTTIETLALTLGAGWASGINLYATVFTLGLLERLGQITLPSELAILSDPLVLVAAALAYAIEFFADKTPGVDSAWDLLHTFIRIPAGAVLAAGAAGGFDVSGATQFASALAGGTLAAGSHLAKASSRVLINTSPEPLTNWTASIAEDLAVLAGLWTALYHPVLFLWLLGLFVLLLAWALPRIWSALMILFRRLARLWRWRSNPSDRALRGTEQAEETRSRQHQRNAGNSGAPEE